MMEENKDLSLDFLFEVSWEICNKVGGIHTVIATKALTVERQMKGRYILIGPDILREGNNPEFEEDPELMKTWHQVVNRQEGIRVRIGRWKVEGDPVVVLVDFSNLFHDKDAVLKELWDNYKVDSISGQWDYVEPVLFGYAAGKVISNYVNTFCKPNDRMVAHFHEWMTASGGLYLKKKNPYVATVFTTHATVMGRCIAGNGLPLYGGLQHFNADELARQFNVFAKHSIEKSAANEFDCFATVSDITAHECKYLLGKEPDQVTPNGFEDDFVWKGKEFEAKRKEGREKLLKVAGACLGRDYSANDPLVVITSGRYEFKNKGLDIFVETMEKLALQQNLKREILAVIAVPAGNNGPRPDIQNYLAGKSRTIDKSALRNTTHYLSDQNDDPVVKKMYGTSLTLPDSRVQILFIPTYLNGYDGIFNLQYYELLAGADISVFASYYEPWGYTPLESVAFSVPTITTTLAGFGLWVDHHAKEHPGVDVIARTDKNDEGVVTLIAQSIQEYGEMGKVEYQRRRDSVLEISKIALWENLISYYVTAYAKALENVSYRTKRAVFDGGSRNEQIVFLRQQFQSSHPNWVRFMIERDLPEKLHPLEVLSKNLWWVWALDMFELFGYIDRELWIACEKNPIAFLDRLSYARFKELEADETFLALMDKTYKSFNAYMAEKELATGPKIAYFSMEYGLHSSLKIYSGGLGILAGDYLKEASDKNVPMVAVGLLYRYGYFTQKLSASGEQEASYEAQNFHKLPISPVRDEFGNWKSVEINFPGRVLIARIWRCDVGRTELYLLDTDHDMNLEEDRAITYHLYGGDWENRLKQELLLGIGGIRALNELGIEADVYHCNEGHAAFIGVERIRNLIDKYELTFSEALEVVRSSSLFTIHTPVPAGHDAFPESMIRQYISHYPDKLNITWEQFVNLGKTNPNDPNERFSMSFLACNLSQEVNGVSWLHGEVSKGILGSMWPGYMKDELHISYVTNGVHLPTWCAPSLHRIYNKVFGGGFDHYKYDISRWQRIYDVPDEELWGVRLKLKNKLVDHVKQRVSDPKEVRFDSPRQMVQIKESIKPDVLTIGFARRFATYKRAHLLFTNLDRLDRIVNNPDRPVQFLFAGKAHPNDKPGQDLIKRIVEISALPQFVGKIIFLQNYDMTLARRLVQGVDIWLNTPTRPLEASGTSGEKAVMNGVMHFSVLDGWWVEGYKEGAGWMLPMERTYEDQRYQDEMDAELIYNTIEDQIAPLYYTRDKQGIPHEWMQTVKRCIADVASNFTTNRMLTDYEDRFYHKLYDRNKLVVKDDFEMARRIAAWKRRVSQAWDKVKVLGVQTIDISKTELKIGEKYRLEVTVDVDGLQPQDVGVEFIIADQITGDSMKIIDKQPFDIDQVNGTVVKYVVNPTIENTGTYDMAIRLFANNPELPHRMDFALVKWV